MGSQNLALVGVLAQAGRLDGLGDQAHLVLLAMAAMAHDDNRHGRGQPLVYFGGWEHLARAALRRRTYDGPAERAVDRCIRQLVKEGLAEPIGRKGSSRGPQQYRLHLELA